MLRATTGLSLGQGPSYAQAQQSQAQAQQPRTPRPLRESYAPFTPSYADGAAAAALATPGAAVASAAALSAQVVGGNPSAMMKDLKPACLALMQRMDAWVLAKKKDLYEARTLYIKDVKELAARREELLKQLESVRNAETELSQTRERQDREQEEMEAVISELAQTKSARKAELDKLLSRIDSLSLEIAAKRRALEEKRREREIATQSLLPDLQVYQHLLAFDIVNQKPNLHRFVFTNIDQSSPRTEHWFELDSTNRAFRLTACKPSIPKADVMVEWLNSSRDLYSFIKAMRRAFVEHVNSRF